MALDDKTRTIARLEREIARQARVIERARRLAEQGQPAAVILAAIGPRP
jgi:hypothetical protein